MLTKKEITTAKAIHATSKEAVESLAGEALITAAWLISTLTENTIAELLEKDSK